MNQKEVKCVAMSEVGVAKRHLEQLPMHLLGL